MCACSVSGAAETSSLFIPQPPTSRPSKRAWDPAANQKAFARWCEAMRAGLFESAWQINDREGQHWPSAHQLWDGRDLTGCPVRLESRHGSGDFVQMVRFLPALSQMGCTVSLSVAPQLRQLVRYFKGACAVAQPGTAAAHEAVLEMMELPYALRMDSDESFGKVPYLHLPAHLVKQTRYQMHTGSGKPKVGVVWTGGAWDTERWVPLKEFSSLFSCTDFEWWSLQPGSSAAVPEFGLRTNHSIARGTLVDLAAAIANLDLLITVDTLAAHLAGAMGKRVWILLKQDADWRWQQDRADSPWYPTARLFRQKTSGNWSTVLRQVGGDLQNSCIRQADRTSRSDADEVNGLGSVASLDEASGWPAETGRLIGCRQNAKQLIQSSTAPC